MTDTEKLREIISESGYKVGFIAAQIGLTPQGLNRKVRNDTEFKASEIQALCELLGITNRDEIFFADM